MNVITLISVIVSCLCGVWLIGLGIFVIVKKIIDKHKAKKEIKIYEQSEEN